MTVGHTYCLEVEGFEIFRSLGGTLSKQEYKDALAAYNKEGMRQVVEDAKHFPFGGYMGGIQVVRQDRSYSSTANASINWGESNKLKKEIIERGDTPKSKEHPDGVPWLIRFSFDNNEYVLIQWDNVTPALRSSIKYNRVLAYKFIATRGKVGVKTKLKEFIASNPLGIYAYPHTKDVTVNGAKHDV